VQETVYNDIAAALEVRAAQVSAVAQLLAEGATVPFISRYRKEATGSLDEVAVTAIRDRLKKREELDRRREAILKSLEKQGHLTDELRAAVMAADAMNELEDIYLPYRPKRRTRGTIAREKGLEPLAEALFAQEGRDPLELAADYIDAEKGVASADEALAGARDIMAEWVNENAEARAALRRLFAEKATIRSTVAAGKEKEAAKYRDYFDWEEPIAAVPSHRLLAMRRGEKEDFLNLTIAPPEEKALEILRTFFIKAEGPDAGQVEMALTDGYRRLLSRSLETEMRLETKERADDEAIRVFSENLRQLLMAPPLGARRVMGIDPGFRTGCKLVCLDRQGKLVHHDTIYPHFSDEKTARAAETVKALCREFAIEAVAVGNGTAGRETEAFVRGLGLAGVQVVMVNESGASVYSASETARREFPDLDLTFRGAVSIGRRLMDPLSELVKIDPKAIGVGQYQHDVDQAALRSALDDVVVSCVNAVGVDVNRASVELLTYVSGLGPQLAARIVEYRNAHGAFDNRRELLKVPRLGPRAFEQAAGFLRIAGGSHPLDASAVHPERYSLVDAMARDLGCDVADLLADEALRKRIRIQNYVSEEVGLPTLRDIMDELAKPGRDPRQRFEAFAFKEDVHEMGDLTAGMRLPGIVTNVTNFGAFVDVGVHQDGLVHISQLADRFVKNPADVVRVGQRVTVTVLDVDTERRRISLSMKSGGGRPGAARGKTSPAVKASRPKRRDRRNGPQPFHNPFADLLKDRLGGDD